MLGNMGAGGLPEPRTQRPISKQRSRAPRQRDRIGRRDQTTIVAVADQLAQTLNIRSNHGPAMCHRLERGLAAHIDAARNPANVSRGEQIRHPKSVADEQSVADVQAFDHLGQRRLPGPGPCNQEMEVGKNVTQNVGRPDCFAVAAASFDGARADDPSGVDAESAAQRKSGFIHVLHPRLGCWRRRWNEPQPFRAESFAEAALVFPFAAHDHTANPPKDSTIPPAQIFRARRPTDDYRRSVPRDEAAGTQGGNIPGVDGVPTAVMQQPAQPKDRGDVEPARPAQPMDRNALPPQFIRLAIRATDAGDLGGVSMTRQGRREQTELLGTVPRVQAPDNMQNSHGRHPSA